MPRVLYLSALLTVLALAVVGPASSQTTDVPFGVFNHDRSQPVEITSDSLRVNQQDGTADFKGNVIVGQGDLLLSANTVHVDYASEGDSQTGRIEEMFAEGDVVLVAGSEAAEADTATYSIDNGKIVMRGNVILTQGENAMSGQVLTINLDRGTGVMEGRVKTIFQTGTSE